MLDTAPGTKSFIEQNFSIKLSRSFCTIWNYVAGRLMRLRMSWIFLYEKASLPASLLNVNPRNYLAQVQYLSPAISFLTMTE